MLGEPDPASAASLLLHKGTRAVVIKLGEQGVWLETDGYSGIIPAQPAEVVDTTGAGDAFDAGVISGLLAGDSLKDACQKGNEAGARVVGKFGAVSAWLE